MRLPNPLSLAAEGGECAQGAESAPDGPRSIVEGAFVGMAEARLRDSSAVVGAGARGREGELCWVTRVICQTT